jgi:hypothetical protein
VRTAADWKERVMTVIEKLRHISPQEFALLGMQNLAYVKPIVVNDEAVFGIFAADGTQVALMPDRAVAIATVRQHELEPVSVH